MKKTIKTMVAVAMLMLICFMTMLARDPSNWSPISLGRRIFSSSQIIQNQEGSQWTCALNNIGELLENCWLAVYKKNGRYTAAEFYHSDENGIMQTGWLNDRGQTFYLKSDGCAVQSECVETISERDYVLDYQDSMLKNRNITVDGENCDTDGNDHVISSIADKTLENPFPSGQSDQFTYLDTYRRQKDVSNLSHDSDLTGVAKAAYDYSSGITLPEVYPLTSATEHSIHRVAFVRAAVIDRESYVYPTEDAVAAVQGTWFVRVGYYKSSGTVMIITAVYGQGEASMLSADETQSRWINDNGRYRCRRTDSSYAANCQVKNPDDDRWYHFDESSCIQAGWLQGSDGKWCYLSTDTGGMLTDAMVDGCVIGGDGVMMSGS